NGEVAWNSFAYTGTRTDNTSTLLASEPIKVGIALSAARPPGAGNYTWLDKDRDGIQDNNEPGLNGVRVDIYDVGADGNANTTDDSLAGFTVTGNNDAGKPGYYMFPFLPKGDYYLKFTPPSTDFRFSKQNSGEDDTVDSDADTTTGLTTKFNLSNAFALKWDAGFYRLNADLDLAKKVNNPVPYLGDGILFTITVTNNGPGGSDGVAVSIPLGTGLVYQSATQSRGSYDAQTGIWTIGDIKAGSSYTLWIVAKVTSTNAIECTAEISASNAPDPDSTPGNKKRGEDDIGSATVFAGDVSGGNSAGLESNGDLSILLAKRAFERKRERAMKIMKGIVDHPIPFGKGLAKSGDKIAAGFGGFVTGDLADLIPETGPVNSTAFVSTPTDLFGATNATSVLAVDYLAPNQRRVAAIFSTTTHVGDTYDHTKIICDRVKGAILEEAWIVEVAEHPFVMAKLRHLNGALDYAISFVAYEGPNDFTLDSRFVRGEYVSPAVGHTEVINFQVWSLAESFTIGIVEDMITLMQSTGTIDYLNTRDDPPGLPDVYVRQGHYVHGKLKLEMVNNVQARQITIHGTAVSVENSPAFPLEKTVVLPTTANDEGFFDVEIETGPLFNTVFTIENDKTTTIDQIFLADGAWNVASDPNDARIDTHKVYVQDPQAFASEGYQVERGAYVKGRTKTWAVLFRQLRPGNLPVDLSAYRFLEFTASGTGSLSVKIEKASIETFDQFHKRIGLTATPQRHIIWFDELKQFTYTGDFTAEDVDALNFVFEGSEGKEQAFEMRISDIRFGSVPTGVEAQNLNGEIPREYTLAQNYPNPFNPTTTITFGLPKTGDVRLSVYDMLGREVVRLVEGRYRAGTYQVNFNAGKLASGHYIYRLQAGEATLTRVMVLVK
ncbi:MAG: SdrD B-like domain-containing protein, partial [bacterium]